MYLTDALWSYKGVYIRVNSQVQRCVYTYIFKYKDVYIYLDIYITYATYNM